MRIEIDTKLPDNWIITTISEIAEYVQRGKSPKYTDWSELPVINQKCIRWHGIDSEYLKFIHLEQWEKWSEERFLQEGDILWNSTGTGTIGRAAIFQGLSEYKKAVVDSHVTIVITKNYNQKLLQYWIMSPAIQFKIDGMYTGSTNQVELSKTEVLSTSLPLPPLNEQKRIVTKIEALQTRSTAVKKELEAIKPLLDQFRQSVLASAFRGDLTKDWREQNPNVEPAQVLLERIRVERRRRWEEAELEKMKAKGNVPKDDKWKKKYKEPEPVDSDGLLELPDSWLRVSLDEIMKKIVDGTHHTPSYIETGIPFISVKDVRDEQIYFDDCKYISLEEHQKLCERCYPELGDLLITKSGTIGRCAVINTNKPFSLFVSVALLKPVCNEVKSVFISLAFQAWFQTINVQNDITGSAIKNLHLIDFRKLTIPIPPIEEQEKIIRRIESLFKLADNIEQQYQQAEIDLEILNQSILAKAFRGELVPQDLNDEPASVLLERIKAERKKAQPKKSKAKKRKTKATQAEYFA